jgi:hypothetical protein
MTPNIGRAQLLGLQGKYQPRGAEYTHAAGKTR